MIGAFVRLTGESGQVGYLICISMGWGAHGLCVSIEVVASSVSGSFLSFLS